MYTVQYTVQYITVIQNKNVFKTKYRALKKNSPIVSAEVTAEGEKQVTTVQCRNRRAWQGIFKAQ